MINVFRPWWHEALWKNSYIWLKFRKHAQFSHHMYILCSLWMAPKYLCIQIVEVSLLYGIITRSKRFTFIPTTNSVSMSHNHKYTYLSRTSSSSLCRSQAMYSRAMSVILGHQDKSRLRSLRRFSATSSTPSSVILEQPERLRAVKFGRLCTMLTTPWLVISQHEWSRRVWVV